MSRVPANKVLSFFSSDLLVFPLPCGGRWKGTQLVEGCMLSNAQGLLSSAIPLTQKMQFPCKAPSLIGGKKAPATAR